MGRLYRKRSSKYGMPPGTLIHIGDQLMENIHITTINYTEAECKHELNVTVKECAQYRVSPNITWFRVEGIHNAEMIEQFGKMFDFHPLLMEDIMNSDQRPKIEDLGNYISMFIKTIEYNSNKMEMHIHQVSLILGRNFVISFEESGQNALQGIQDRIITGKGRVRRMGSDYLLYVIIDHLIDQYFLALEMFGEMIEEVEERILINPESIDLQTIHRMKRELILLRKTIWPLRDVITSLQRIETAMLKEGTAIYLRDIHDHVVQVMDTVETFREMVSVILELYLSSLNHRTNEVQKILTIIATIFLPLTFVSSVYGMNFKYLPELQWDYGYFYTLGFMGIIAFLLMFFFYKKGWI